MNTTTEPPPILSTHPHPSPDSICLSFPNDAQCMAGLRATTRTFLRRTRPDDRALLADALLVVTELASNVIQHTDGPGLLTLISYRHALGIDVGDTSRTPPTVIPLSSDNLHGRGLLLVAALTGSLTLTLDAGSGKTVHALLPDRSTTPAPRPSPRPCRTW
ncbi:ATP-binding protein [Kitasatospora purpeofusca]|uniref:ATP-binding protein n=1 Tax=Kitasatospora purpeofusca TaxID=67352 RepID=UPI002E1426A6|nr:ATP-binding protein [Kitasatospora purpeofusca]WSR38085.1 ATP-binding protein [Kitasatospora purpeofusca]